MTAPAIPAAATRVPGAALGSRLAAFDPGWRRARTAARGTLGAVLALAAATPFAHATGQSTSVPLLAAVIAMLAGVAVNDVARRDQIITLALLPLPAALALALGAFTTGKRLETVLAFAVVVPLATYARRWAPRGTALGFVVFNALFFAQFLQATAAQVPYLAAAALLGVVVAAVVRFALLVESPRRTTRRMLLAVVGAGARALDAAAATLRAPGEPPRRARQALVSATGDLTRTALLVEQQLQDAHEADALRSGVLRLDLAVAHAAAAMTAAARARLPADDRALAAQRAGALADDLRRRRPGDFVQDAGPFADPVLAHLHEALDEVAWAAEVLRGEADGDAWARAWDAAADQVPPPSGPSPADLALRQAVQATCAAVLALVVGQLLSPTRWYWAVITAFLVFAGADTRAATVRRAVARTAGTVAGVVVGLAVASLLAGHASAALVVLVVALFLGFWVQQVSFFASSLGITVVLSMLYVLLGLLSTGLLVLRIEETAVGAVLGGVASLVVLPLRSGRTIDAAEAAVLTALAALLGALEPGRPGLARSARDLDAAYQALRDRARPAAKGVPTSRARAIEQRVFALSSCTYGARLVAATALDGAPVDLPHARRLAERAAALAGSRLAPTSRATSRSTSPATSPGASPVPLASRAGGEPPAGTAVRHGEDRAARHARGALDRIEQALDRLEGSG